MRCSVLFFSPDSLDLRHAHTLPIVGHKRLTTNTLDMQHLLWSVSYMITFLWLLSEIDCLKKQSTTCNPRFCSHLFLRLLTHMLMNTVMNIWICKLFANVHAPVSSYQKINLYKWVVSYWHNETATITSCLSNTLGHSYRPYPIANHAWNRDKHSSVWLLDLPI